MFKQVLNNTIKTITSLKLVIVFILFLSLSLLPTPLSLAHPKVAFAGPQESAQTLGNDIDAFLSAGARGYLIWQFSGEFGNGMHFANDQYAFFRNTDTGAAICSMLKQKNSQYSGKFVGVNMWDVGGGAYSYEVLNRNFNWLHNECGVSVIRTFAKVGSAANMERLLEIANQSGIKVIIAIGDYSNGGGGVPAAADAAWYQNGYQDYKNFAQSVVDRVKGHPALYGLELANEPHCGGQPETTIEYYKNWGADVGAILKTATSNVGYGQMANPGHVCDDPNTGAFKTTNSISQITMTSAHYYNTGDRAAAFKALEQSQQMGKPFYIGEAGIEINDRNPTGETPPPVDPEPLDPGRITAGNTQIGTHLGYGDVNTQISVMQMLKSKGAEAGFPVTVMLDMGAITDGNLNAFKDVLSETGFSPILRINQACEASPEEIQNKVALIRRIIGAQAIITFGNEVNNPRECGNTSAFVANYRAINGDPLLAPSALDFYNGDYPAESFIHQNGLTDDYRNAPVRTANAYGCTDVTDTESCNPSTTNTIKIGTRLTGPGDQIPNSKLYLTEFSLSPNGGANAPDTDLDQVRTFIETRGPKTGARYITPLIRNVCHEFEQDGEWLLYLHGDFYTTSGLRIGPNNCSAMDKDNPYGHTPKKDENQYYMPTLLRVDQSHRGTGELKDKYLYNMIMDQGYQVHMPSPMLTITQSTKGDWDAFFDWMNRAGIGVWDFTAVGKYQLDLTKGEIPLFRGDEASEETEKISSLEGYFASNNPETSALTTKGVLESMLNIKQQCAIKIDNLYSVKDFCYESEGDKTLLNPSLCAMHEQIPDTDYFYFSPPESGEKDLLSAIVDNGLNCDELTKPWSENLGVEKREFLEIKHALFSMPFSLDKVYRWAFIIIAPLIEEDDGYGYTSVCRVGNFTNEDDRFCMLWQPNQAGADPFNRWAHAPIFGAFKIPLFGTNEIKSLEHFKNSAEIVADGLLNTAQQKAIKESIGLLPAETKVQVPSEEEGREDEMVWDIGTKPDIRSEIYSKIPLVREMKLDPDARMGLPIYCDGMPMCDCAHESCPLRQALVEIVNANFYAGHGYSFRGQPAPHVMVEKAGDISVSSYVSYDASRIFHPKFDMGKDVYFLGQRDGDAGKWPWGLRVKRSDTRDMHDDVQRQKVGVYTIAPIHNDHSTLQYLEEAMKTFFTKKENEAIIETNCLADGEGKCGELPLFYPFKGAKFGFKSKSEQFFHDPSKANQCPCVDGSGLGGGYCVREQCDNNSASVVLDDQNVGLYLPGARMGWYIRKIQETLHEFGSVSYNYVASCERTEDLFLGRCGGKDYGDGRTPYNGRDIGVGTWSGECKPITDDSSPCSINNLRQVLAEYPANAHLSDRELTKRAKQGSIICNAESGGNPQARNEGCLSGTSVDYSIGLFQINLLAHSCPQYFDYSWEPPSCTILTHQDRVDSCADEVEANNIKYAMEISSGGANWGPWATSKDYACGPALDQLEANPDFDDF